MLDDARSTQRKVIRDCPRLLPCALRASSSMISHDGTAFFSPRISMMVLFFGQGSTSLSTFTGQENTPVTAVFEFSVDQGKLAVLMDQLNGKLSLTTTAPFTLQSTLKSVHVKELNCFLNQPVHFPSFPIFIFCFFSFFHARSFFFFSFFFFLQCCT